MQRKGINLFLQVSWFYNNQALRRKPVPGPDNNRTSK